MLSECSSVPLDVALFRPCCSCWGFRLCFCTVYINGDDIASASISTEHWTVVLASYKRAASQTSKHKTSSMDLVAGVNPRAKNGL